VPFSVLARQGWTSISVPAPLSLAAKPVQPAGDVRSVADDRVALRLRPATARAAPARMSCARTGAPEPIHASHHCVVSVSADIGTYWALQQGPGQSSPMRLRLPSNAHDT